MLCQTHSKGGIRTYCHINQLTDHLEGEHREINHKDLTLWAKHMVSEIFLLNNEQNSQIPKALGTATKYWPPNVKKYDHPPTKKPRTSQAPVHIAVNIAPAEGNGMVGHVKRQTIVVTTYSKSITVYWKQCHTYLV